MEVASESSFVAERPADRKADNRVIAGFWRRLLGFTLDGLLLGFVGFAIGLFLFEPLARLGGWGRLVGFCVALVYFGVLNSSIGKGQTIGKRIMKIEVVNRSGNHITLGRSFLRYAVLGTPFFLNGALIPPNVFMSPIGYIIGFLVFGFGGAIIYLYIFNRCTRQSLHDLVVGTLVTKTTPQGPVVGSIWRPHFVVVGTWFVAVIALSVVTSALSRKGIFPELLAVQKSIQSSGKVHIATVTVGKVWHVIDGNRSETTYFQLNAIWRGRPVDYKSAARQLASIVLRDYSEIMNRDILAVAIAYGYDIGIARAWRSLHVQHSPSEWQDILAKSSPE